MLNVTKKIFINASQEAVSAYMRDLTHLPEYEQKVTACRVSYPDQLTALAQVRGRYVGIPWQGVFEMRFTPDGGFKSRMARGPLKTMVGAFHLEVADNGVWLTHSESYRFPFPLSLLYPVLRPWLARSMAVELEIIRDNLRRTQ